jgi:hypothetical protein
MPYSAIAESRLENLTEVKLSSTPRKEVIHPQVLLRIPCYDLVPISGFALGPRYIS